MLNVDTAPPPVPQVSTCLGILSERDTIALRNARTTPATTSGLSPVARRDASSAPLNRLRLTLHHEFELRLPSSASAVHGTQLLDRALQRVHRVALIAGRLE